MNPQVNALLSIYDKLMDLLGPDAEPADAAFTAETRAVARHLYAITLEHPNAAAQAGAPEIKDFAEAAYQAVVAAEEEDGRA